MCPAGVKNVQGCDPMICATASCPGRDSAEVTCRINPCGQCKAEFLDKNNRLVKCKFKTFTRTSNLIAHTFGRRNIADANNRI